MFGNVVTLTYDEALDGASVPSADAFEVATAGTDDVTVESVAISGTRVRLRLDEAVGDDDTVTVSYALPDDPDDPRLRDRAGNEAPALTEHAVAGATDSTAPMLRSATVNRDVLTLTYDEALYGTSVPAAIAYRVRTSAANDVTVDSVAVAGTTVTLTLGEEVLDTHTVTVSYTVPSRDPLQDSAGNEARALTGEAVENVGDTTAPVLRSATVNRHVLTLTYGEELDGGIWTPWTDAYRVRTNGANDVPVESVAVEGTTVKLTLGEEVGNATVTVSYAVPVDIDIGGPRLQDRAGNESRALTGQPVENESPTRADREIQVDSAEVRRRGVGFAMQMSEPLDTENTPPRERFTVTVNGTKVTISNVDVMGTQGAFLLVWTWTLQRGYLAATRSSSPTPTRVPETTSRSCRPPMGATSETSPSRRIPRTSCPRTGCRPRRR